MRVVLDRMELRKQILSKMFNADADNLRFKELRNEGQSEVLEAMLDPIFEKAKHAVLTKYLFHCKTTFCDQAMFWRLKVLACRLNSEEQRALTLGISSKVKSSEKYL